MEEILASIRRIIADDQEGGKATPSATLQQPARAAPQPAPPPPQRPVEEEILDLSEVATPVAARGPSLDLDHEDIGYRDVADMDFDSVEVEDEPPLPPVAPPPAAPAAAFDPEPLTHERLISNSTDTNVTSSFNMLAHTVLTQNARTLEDLVKDMLKPMLKGWLDQNLPTLVERLVRAEIERVTRGR
jgi:cell pole-organizing protein PopZ